MSNAERNAEIIRRRSAGELPYQIAEALGVTRNTVIGVCNRAGLCGVEEGANARATRLCAHKGEQCHNAKLTGSAVRSARAEYIPYDRRAGASALAKRHGVSSNAMRRAITRETWADV